MVGTGIDTLEHALKLSDAAAEDVKGHYLPTMYADSLDAVWRKLQSR